MYELTQNGLTVDANEDEQALLETEDIHPHKSGRTHSPGNAVSFPKLIKFSTYLLRHYGADIVDEINQMLYDGELASICGVDCFCSQRLPHDQCRINPRMSFWRVNKYEFTAAIIVHLSAEVYNNGTTCSQRFTLYVSLDFCIDDRITYEFGSVSLKPPAHKEMKLDEYLIPVINLHEVNIAAEEQWGIYLPEALHDYRLMDPYKLAEKMGLSISYYKLYKNHKTRSVLYWSDSELLIASEKGEDESAPEKVKVAAGTIVINENVVQRDRARLNVFHECFHDEYHWLFFRLQDMHNNNLRTIRKTKRAKRAGAESKNPLTILEWQAKQGSRALMLPDCILRPMIREFKDEMCKLHTHIGRIYEGIGLAIADLLGVPKYLIRSRMIQLGYWQAQGALNYIRTSESRGQYISPFVFSRESCPTTSHTFVISPLDSFKLYEQNKEYRAMLDSGSFIYIEGHLCLNDPAYVTQSSLGPCMTDWANLHIDECCLRFENVYEVDDNYEFHLNRINSDEEYNRHYLDFILQGQELTQPEILEKQGDLIASLPDHPGHALEKLMKSCGNLTVAQMAEYALVSSGTVKNWRKEEYRFKPETALRIIVGLHLPPWISARFLQIAGVDLKYYGLHMLYRNIISCHYMDTMYEVNCLIQAAGYPTLGEQQRQTPNPS